METEVVPPDDDCCPVCHGGFNLPCRTSCSHWFCGECILRVWLHGDATEPCKCPMCCRLFSSLAPLQEAFDYSQDPEAKKIMEDVTRYNRLHVGGMRGLIQKIFDLPFFVRMALQDMMDPDKASSNLSRFIASSYVLKVETQDGNSEDIHTSDQILLVQNSTMLLGMTYVIIPLDFLPYDSHDILNLFDFCAVASVTIVHIFALCRARRSPR